MFLHLFNLTLFLLFIIQSIFVAVQLHFSWTYVWQLENISEKKLCEYATFIERPEKSEYSVIWGYKFREYAKNSEYKNTDQRGIYCTVDDWWCNLSPFSKWWGSLFVIVYSNINIHRFSSVFCPVFDFLFFFIQIQLHTLFWKRVWWSLKKKISN